ncbi:MAG TPA: thioredoxin family protein [Flavobacterium sp.]|nr:thioredoxin family protein [Flavobacterium sp.]
MKKVLFILFLTLGSLAMNAQEAKWYTDMDEAMALSEKTKKPMLLFFTGSDWCGWCIRLQKEVLKTPEFAAWAKDNVILVELDFPRKSAQSIELKQQNAGLAKAFSVRGYPTVWITRATKDSEGKVSFQALGKTGYVAGGPTAWLEGAKQILANKKA